MTKEEYFNKIDKFQKEQEKQKKRGLNNYNVMSAIRKIHEEVGMHSNFIYSLLDIYGEHYQDDLFVNLFVEHALGTEDFGNIEKVIQEYDANGRRIDFVIETDKYLIGIEMKIYASDLPNQIFDYHKFLNDEVEKLNKNKNDKNKKEVKIFYLTLDGKEASKKSLCNLKEGEYKNISFEKDILKWLEESLKLVKDIPNLSNAIGYYMDVINRLIGKYESPINDFRDLFFKEENIFQAYETYEKELCKCEYSDKVKDGFERAKKEKINSFFEETMEPLLKNNDDLRFQDYDDTPNDGKLLRFSFKDEYRLRLYFKKDSCSIAIGANDKLNYQSIVVEEVEKKLEKFSEKAKIYLVGRNKGVLLKDIKYKIPELNGKTLFNGAEDYNIISIEDITEIQTHIEKIQENLFNDLI